MNIFKTFHQDLMTIFKKMDFPLDITEDMKARITAEPPRDLSHGDLATNVAMVLAKPLSMPPHAVAEKIVPLLKEQADVLSIQVASPGFINVKFTPAFWYKQLDVILQEGRAYGHAQIGEGRTLNLEYVSTNPTGPMHVGHCRGAIFGDILASLMEKVGYSVTREFYINDAGVQVLELARSLYARYCQVLDMPGPDLGAYGGEYLIQVAKDLVAERGSIYINEEESVWLTPLKEFAVKTMMKQIKDDLALLNIYHDVFTSEDSLVRAGRVKEALDRLDQLGLIYEGILEPPKGKVVEDYEPRPQTLFRSTPFGDDCDRPLKKSDGTGTYFANDIAYHYDKFQRGFTHLINIWGADHGGYVKRLSAAVTAISEGKACVHTHLCQMVKFVDQGQALKMSKRAGIFITVAEAVQKVGRDALRFLMVWRKNDAPLDFDFQKAVEATKDNPVFYVQYAHARICSVERHAATLFKNLDEESISFELLRDEADLVLIKTLSMWPRVIETAALAQEPHRIAYFLYEVAGVFHALWTLGKEKSDLRFIHPTDKKLTATRLALLRATAFVLQSGLDIMGVEAPQEMVSEERK